MQRLQPGVLHLEDAAHLLDEQQRVRANPKRAMAVRPGPLQRREQTAVLRDVVGGHANRFVEFLDERTAGVLDADAEACRPGVAARTAVDVGDKRFEGSRFRVQGSCRSAAGASGAAAARAPARNRGYGCSCRTG